MVITTSTASGKTLSFLLPVLQEILENPLTRAVFVYPTKPLPATSTGRCSLFWIFRKWTDHAGVYDGDTMQAERSRIRKSANIILTNPEMLNSAFLPNHSSYGFDFIFSNLKYVATDELHTYRGAFGGSSGQYFPEDEACLRLLRIKTSIPVQSATIANTRSSVLCSSATIANPAELAERICGEKICSGG